MEPVIVVGGARVFHGDCVDVLKQLPENSVDSIVTDPPYGLEFMGKDWDAPWKKSGDVIDNPASVGGFQDGAGGNPFSRSRIRYGRDNGAMIGFQLWATEWAVECLRVLKPGGHILAFGGSRTWHRLAVAVEDAGFELRDSIAWIYGSGFPKSLDVSKAIDKRRDDTAESDKLAIYLRGYVTSGMNWSEVDKKLGTVNARQKFFTASTAGMKSRVPSWEQWLELKALLGFDDSMDAEVWRLNGRKGQPGEAWEAREVTGHHEQSAAHQVWMQNYSEHTALPPKEKRDKSATPEAKQWEGWGTALKPAFEPVVVGRKPFGKGVTVAENVLAWGVGGLNIDGSRIGFRDEADKNTVQGAQWHAVPNDTYGKFQRQHDREVMNGADSTPDKGRWPANVILDEVTAGLLDEQSGVSKSPATYTRKADGFGQTSYGLGESSGIESLNYGDSGGASRFFYVAKASKRDRNEGLEELEAKSAAEMTGRKEGSAGLVMKHVDGSDKANAYAGTTGSARQNFHPTVKPTALMRYLIKLVTPAGGTVLDPFTGSGSTGKAALLDGFQFVGVELTEEYLPIIEGRLRWANEQEETDGKLF